MMCTVRTWNMIIFLSYLRPSPSDDRSWDPVSSALQLDRCPQASLHRQLELTSPAPPMAPVGYVVRQNRLDGWRHQHKQLVADLHRLTTPLNLTGVVA